MKRNFTIGLSRKRRRFASLLTLAFCLGTLILDTGVMGDPSPGFDDVPALGASDGQKEYKGHDERVVALLPPDVYRPGGRGSLELSGPLRAVSSLAFMETVTSRSARLRPEIQSQALRIFRPLRC